MTKRTYRIDSKERMDRTDRTERKNRTDRKDLPIPWPLEEVMYEVSVFPSG